jgi:flagellar motor switch protein FliN/FliY
LPTLDKVSVDIAVVLGTYSMPVYQVLSRGAIIELDASKEDEVNILAKKGTVIISGSKIAVEVKELLPRSPEAK